MLIIWVIFYTDFATFFYCFSHVFLVLRLHRMHEILTIVHSVCVSVCLSRGLSRQLHVQCTLYAVCVWGHSVQPLPNDFGLLFYVL